MRPLRSIRRPDNYLIGYLAAGLIGFAIRANYVLTVTSHHLLNGDAYYFYYWPAAQLAKGHGFLSPLTLLHDKQLQSFAMAHPGALGNDFRLEIADKTYAFMVPGAAHPPGFIGLLAILRKLGFESPTAMKLWICVMGAATVVLIGLLVARMVNRRAGLIAACIAAIYPNIWINDTLLLSESLMVFGFVLGLIGVYAFRESHRNRSLLLASIGFTLGALAQPEIVLLFGFVILPVVLARREMSWKQRISKLGLAAMIPLVVFGSWTAYNLGRFEKPVLLSTGLGQTAMVGTCDLTFDGPFTGYYNLDCVKEYPRPPVTDAGYVDESVKNANYTREVAGYLNTHRSELPKVVLAREARLLGLWNPTQQNNFDHHIDRRGSMRLVTISQWSFWALGILAIAGGIILRRRRVMIYPLLAEIGITLLVTAITFGMTRYRAGMEICVVILAAVTLDAGLNWLRGRRIRNEPPGSDLQVESSNSEELQTV